MSDVKKLVKETICYDTIFIDISSSKLELSIFNFFHCLTSFHNFILRYDFNRISSIFRKINLSKLIIYFFLIFK